MYASNAITIANEFSVSRTSKAGKITNRGILGVITSGNAAERAQLADRVIDNLIANNNYRHLMREVVRVFPTTFVAKSPLVVVDKANKDIYIRVGYQTLERFDVANPSKAMAHQYAERVLEVIYASGKEIKGEKLAYANSLSAMLRKEAERLAAVEAEQLALEGKALDSAIAEEYARLETEAAVETDAMAA